MKPSPATAPVTNRGPEGSRRGGPEGSRRDRLRRIVPIVLAVVGSLLVSIAAPHSADATVLLAVALGLMAAIGVLVVLVPAPRVRPLASVTLTATFCLAVGLLREAGGGAQSGYATLLLVPIVWQALYGVRSELFATLALVAATFVTPILLFGEPGYPPSQWRAAVLFTVIGGGIGLLLADTTRARDRLLDQLSAAATTDALTGLANRWAWDDLLARELARAERSGAPLTVALIDVDHFKRYNDEHGHTGGDDLLRDLAQRWTAALRQGDALARWGGEEFIALLPDTTCAEGVDVVVRLLRSSQRTTCSAGVTTWVPAQSPEALVAEADRLLYRAKAAGRDRVVWHAGTVLVGAMDGTT